MEVRRSRPDAVEWRRLISSRVPGGTVVHQPARLLVGEPGPLVIRVERVGNAEVAIGIGADCLQGHNLGWIGRLLSVGAVAPRAARLEESLAPGGKRAVE